MRKIKLEKALRGYKFIGLTVLLFFSLNLVFYFLCLDPNMKSSLSMSLAQPWGIVTSVFVHENATHLMNNLESFLSWILLFLVVTSSLNPRNRNKISKVLMITVFIGAFVVNGAEMIIWGIRGSTTIVSRGSSGLVYSVLGVVFVSALVNFQRNCLVLVQKMAEFKKRLLSLHTWKHLIRGALTLSFVIVIPAKLFISANEFFGLAPGIDVLGHAFGFLVGLIGCIMGVYLTSRDLFK